MIWMMDITLQPAIKDTKYVSVYKIFVTCKKYCEIIRRLFKWHFRK